MVNGIATSQPLDTSPSWSSKPTAHDIAVHVVESEHFVQFALATVMFEQSNDDSHPVDASPSESKVLGAHEDNAVHVAELVGVWHLSSPLVKVTVAPTSPVHLESAAY